MKKSTITLCLAVILFLGLGSVSMAKDPIRFGVPPWPGVEVKTEITAQLLDALGYDSDQLQIGPPVVYKGMEDGEVDVFLGVWTPQQNPLLEPLLDTGAVEIVQTNLDDALIGLCVPDFVAEAGVQSFADLNPHADKFRRHIYNIEVGSPMHTAMEDIIANDVAGLGDWDQTGTTTPIMLTEVMNLINNDQWVAFACWRPHWMNIRIDMKYLEPVDGTESFASESLIHTVVRDGFAAQYPDAYQFLQRMQVTSEIQSYWINEYGQKNLLAKEVATTWIKDNMDIVSSWFAGITTPAGTPAMELIQNKFK
ncbi:glycine betaine ABC transporter substrate-binding protein [Desulfonatronovibrio hydrogenovorans]|uniref:glycine betaine ABC transporter substrate-binding protein n=1 Tax=Desulfonatronovibrio hydrogenovorans TaxID=53245 RepID=UPI00048C7075|nr:glycine betaine ABC transporter substrate-binding protein [Desulfonatronovibrio hydrogenovorans]